MSLRTESPVDDPSEGVTREGNGFGPRLRAARERRRIGVREMSRQIDVSASMISQIELGRVMPSVKTLYAMTSVLGITLDELFAAEQEAQATAPAAEVEQAPAAVPVRGSVFEEHPGMVQRAATRKTLTLGSGVRWELLTSAPDPEIEFQQAVYQVGGESCPAEALMRHGGREYGLVLDGRLGVTVGFETHVLEPGDSISFDSSIPHRLFNLADHATTAIWVVVGRRGDRRLPSAG